MSIGFTPYGTISKKKRIYWEAQLFGLIRSFSDGITFLSLKINLDRYIDDHSPVFQVEFTLFNLYFHFWIYQNNYEEEVEVTLGDDDVKKMRDMMKFFGINSDEFDNLAADYLEQGIPSHHCYKLAY
jgi:hypothetical protein